MKRYLPFQLRYFGFWLLFFALARGLFLAYESPQAATLPAGDLARTFGYGLWLDASAAGYLCALPFLAYVAACLLGPRLPLARLVAGYSACMIVVASLLITTDLELYRVWGYRLNATFVDYLRTPAEALASAGSAPLSWLLLALAALLLAAWGLYAALVRPVQVPAAHPRRAVLPALLAAAVLILPIRGGWQQIPINQSQVYFSDRPFANHAALNAAWNLGDALNRRNTDPVVLPHFMADSTAQRLVAGLYPPPTQAPDSLLTERRPNVLFIILESFTAKLVGSVGGERGVTPNLDSLAGTGVTFTHIYAAGERSQKGLVALLSGYPNLSQTSIINYLPKTEHLPHLRRSLGAVGYSAAYYYGGELEFANMRSYLHTAGYERLVDKSSFAARDQNSKWGAHDHVLFDKILADLPRQRQPWLVTAFTLSSHEPFEIPIAPRFPGTSEAALFRNSVAYTDWALGRFLRQARQQPWWAHTLVVLCADHGHPQPGNTPYYDPRKFQVPLVLAGGALRPEVRGQVRPVLGSQTDVATTLLRQLGLPTTAYHWGRDLLAPIKEPFAYYCYTDGFGAVTPAGTVTWENGPARVSSRTRGVPARQLQLGKAYEQASTLDFERR